MSILILQLPARPRQAAPAAEAGADGAPARPAKRLGDELNYVITADGLSVQRQGSATPDLLPRGETVVAVVAASDVSWHRIPLPKAPAARMRAALTGLLEEALLDDPERVHLAVAPLSKPGEPAWIAACDRAWLLAQLAPIEKAGVRVDRVAPAVWPDDPPAGYFHEAADDTEDDTPGMALTWSTSAGAATWPVQGSLARGLLPEPLPPSARFFATPAVAAPAERWLAAPVTVQTQAEHLLQAARSLWNLRQFDLAASNRGLSAVSEFWRRFKTPAWRPVRWGLGALVVMHLLGLNLWAWEQRSSLTDKRKSMDALLRTAHPQVQAVIDAPIQMRRENDSLRIAAGQAGADDLEPLLQVAASAWPANSPLQGFQFEAGKLTLAVPGWGVSEIEQFRSAIEATGWRVESAEGRVTLSRARRAS